jgi:DNA helicase INO80
MAQSNVNRMTNHRRISHLCAREVRKSTVIPIDSDQNIAVPTSNKTIRDIPTKARRLTREMLLFWKKNEKEEREKRKRAEKEQLERMKVEEELREAKRQARKLNFLITQTELYSHFVSKKTGQGILWVLRDDHTTYATCNSWSRRK